jgi:hypothetical protein
MTFEMEGTFFQEGEDTITRLDGKITVPVPDGTTMAEITKRMKGPDGLLASVEKSAEAKLDGTGVKVWLNGVAMKKGEAVIAFRVTIMDFNAFDGLRKALESEFGKL